jgi:hypothetical protein
MLDYCWTIWQTKRKKSYGANHNSLFLLVPPARIELAAHGLGNLQPSNVGTPKDSEGVNYFRWLTPFLFFGIPWEKQGIRGVFSPIC